MRRKTITMIGGLLTVTAILLAGCGGTTTSGKSATTLNLAFQNDMPSGPDPDLFYDVEGLLVTNNVYEGLLQYEANSTKIGPALASSYTISPSGLTYTFHLRSNATFSDGTSFNSTAMKDSFARRTALQGGPAYMLEEVAGVETPSPTIFVVHLKRRDAPFLSYLASPYGPKAISPTAIKLHTVSGDYARKWLSTHSAGTGPYEITEFVPGQQYVLKANPHYWGTPKPTLQTVNIAITPDPTTSLLKLESGEQDAIFAGLAPTDIARLKGTSGVKLYTFGSAYKLMIFLNAAKGGVFANQALRRALLSGIDREEIIQTALGSTGVLTNQLFPEGVLPSGEGEIHPTVSKAQLMAMVSALKDKKVSVAYIVTSGGVEQREGELLQEQLNALGFEATTRGINIAQAYSLPTKPSLRPDILITQILPDDLAPDSTSRIFYHSNGPVNWLGCSSAEADRDIDAAASAPSEAEVDAISAKAAEAIFANGCAIPVANLREVYALRSNYEGVVHDPATADTIQLKDLR